MAPGAGRRDRERRKALPRRIGRGSGGRCVRNCTALRPAAGAEPEEDDTVSDLRSGAVGGGLEHDAGSVPAGYRPCGGPEEEGREITGIRSERLDTHQQFLRKRGGLCHLSQGQPAG